MSLAADRPEFAPPPQRGTPRAIAFALAAHAVLIAALTWGVHWKRDAESDAVEAEIWSTTVQQAAPRLTQPPAPVPPPAPAPVPTPAPPRPPPPPPPAVKAPEPAPAPRPPDIALEREKKAREQKEREQEIERAKQEKKMEAAKKAAQEKKELEAKRRAEEEAQDRREAQEKAQADARKKKEAEAKQQQQQQQQQAEAAKKKEADAAKQAAADRAATLKRMQGLAGASGDDNATGNALKSSGPSGSYGGRVAAAVRPNVVFPDAELVNGNPAAEFDVRLAPDGTIVGTPRLVKSSGLPAWDQAALRALQKTEKLPRDVDGRVPPALIVELKPKR